MMHSLFDHEDLRVYQNAIEMVAWLEGVYPQINRKVSACDHLARASVSVPVNIAEASGKSSMNERRQFVDTAYGSALECAACLDVLRVLGCVSPSIVHTGKVRLSGIVSMLIGYRASTGRLVREEAAPFGADSPGEESVIFDHEKLDVYRRAMGFVAWCERLRQEQIVVESLSFQTVLDRTSTAQVLNIAEGNGKFSTSDRCRFVGHARTAALQAAANLDVVAARHPAFRDRANEGKAILSDAVRMLVAWQRSLLRR